MKNLTDITLLLDKSGSMFDLKQDVEGGIAKFINEQRTFGANAVLSLIEFDHLYDVKYIAKPINEADTITLDVRGYTAYLDALGKTIINVGNRLSSMSEEERPDKVLIVVFTDGYENSSVEFTKSKIREMISHQESVYNWKFVFLGANMDATLEGQTLGVTNAASYSSTSKGVSSAFSALSHSVSNYRNGGILEKIEVKE